MPWRARFPAVGLATNILLPVFRVHQPFFFFCSSANGRHRHHQPDSRLHAGMRDRGASGDRLPARGTAHHPCDAHRYLSPRILRVIEELAGDWRRLDQRIDGLSGEIEALARQDQACSRLMTVPGLGPIISSASCCPSDPPIGTAAIRSPDGSDTIAPPPRMSLLVQVFGRRQQGGSARSTGRRPKSAKARSRGKFGTGGAASAMRCST
jgi:hypothetical protein